MMTGIRQQAVGISKDLKLIAYVPCTMLALSSPIQAQQPRKVLRIGYLSSNDATLESARSEAIGLALRDLGYIDGQNIAVEYRYMQGKVDRAPALAAELVGLKVDIILVAGGDIPIRAAKNATTTIPIVMMGKVRSCRDGRR
jgi:putative tryptophan/tyrosine transport system substrate-binding protein